MRVVDQSIQVTIRDVDQGSCCRVEIGLTLKLEVLGEDGLAGEVVQVPLADFEWDACTDVGFGYDVSADVAVDWSGRWVLEVVIGWDGGKQGDFRAGDAERVFRVQVVPSIVLHPGPRNVDVHGEGVNNDRIEVILDCCAGYL